MKSLDDNKKTKGETITHQAMPSNDEGINKAIQDHENKIAFLFRHLGLEKKYEELWVDKEAELMKRLAQAIEYHGIRSDEIDDPRVWASIKLHPVVIDTLKMYFDLKGINYSGISFDTLDEIADDE